jgi:hypothetical protein
MIWCRGFYLFVMSQVLPVCDVTFLPGYDLVSWVLPGYDLVSRVLPVCDVAGFTCL